MTVRITNAFEGILNEGVLTNQSGAIIINVIHTDWGLLNLGIVVNRATLVIDTCFIRNLANHGQFQNFDTISLSTAAEYGIYNRDTLINNASGLFQITGDAGIDDYAICNTALLLNYGKIHIKDFNGRGIVNQDIGGLASIINHDTIVVQAVRTSGFINYDSLYNRDSGAIIVKDLTLEEYSVALSTYHGTCINDVRVIVENIKGNGISSSGHFANKGTIVVPRG